MSTTFQTSATVDRLTALWAKRYTPDLTTLPDANSPLTHNALLQAASPEGRALTIEKLRDRLSASHYQFANLQAKALYEFLPNVVNLDESRRFADVGTRVYLKLFEQYQQASAQTPTVQPSALQPPANPEQQTIPLQTQPQTASQQPILHQFQIALKEINPLVELELSDDLLKIRLWTTSDTPLSSAITTSTTTDASNWNATHVAAPGAMEWGTPNVRLLTDALAAVFEEYRQQYTLAKSWRTVGFLTTQLNFTNQMLLRKLTPVEQVLIRPYFQFLEEMACMPWLRVCQSAAQHELTSPAFTLVEKMMSSASKIGRSTYEKMLEAVPNHSSRRGRLTDPEVAHSCLRDLDMFQSYLWLALLEKSFAPIDKELLNVCVMVMDAVDVKWDLIERWNQTITAEILQRLTAEQQTVFQPYAEVLQEAFRRRRTDFGYSRQLAQTINAQISDIHLKLQKR